MREHIGAQIGDHGVQVEGLELVPFGEDGDGPGPWGEPVPISYTQRDVLLYAVGIGIQDLRFTFKGHPQFAVFPTFAIRWGGTGLALDRSALPASPGPLNIDAEGAYPITSPTWMLVDKVQSDERVIEVYLGRKSKAA